jgi:chemotaxis protein CheZ
MTEPEDTSALEAQWAEAAAEEARAKAEPSGASSLEAEWAAAAEEEARAKAEPEGEGAMEAEWAAAAAEEARSKAMFNRVGHITRQLHDALQELGYADRLKDTAGELPDAKSRLNYIAKLTGEAADKVLNSVDAAKAKQDEVVQISRLLESLFPAKPALAEQLGRLRACGEQTDQHLTDIMMAQDFHDLTGQVIARVVKLAANIEEQLLQLLVDVAPQQLQPPKTDPLDLSGPVVNPEGRSDVAANQQDVDDLLASLGF